jgi:hypothetical protein
VSFFRKSLVQKSVDKDFGEALHGSEEQREQIRAAFAELAKRFAEIEEREKLFGEMWKAFHAWWGWDRPLARTRRNGHRRYQLRHVHAAAAYLGIKSVTLYRALASGDLTEGITEGLSGMAHPEWMALEVAVAKDMAAKRIALWKEPLQIRHGDAVRLEREWREQWARKNEHGQTLQALVHGTRRKPRGKAKGGKA